MLRLPPDGTAPNAHPRLLALPQVKSILSDTELVAEALNSKDLGERKNGNLPGVLVDLPVLGEKDVDDVQNFACKWVGRPQGVWP